MKNDLNKHHRRSIRLKNYDYSSNGAYFITICCQNKEHRFGEIRNGKMILNAHGQIAFDEWLNLSKRYHHAEFDTFQIMPNHVHGIIVLNSTTPTVGAPLAGALDHDIANGNIINGNIINNNAINGVAVNETRAPARGAPTAVVIGNIVGAYKSLVANRCLEIYKSQNQMIGIFWQRNYYEHIIRNNHAFVTISNYILNNPKKWTEDRFFVRKFIRKIS